MSAKTEGVLAVGKVEVYQSLLDDTIKEIAIMEIGLPDRLSLKIRNIGLYETLLASN